MGIKGRAYGARATLDVAGDALTWRAMRGGVKENIATTLHDVRAARCTVVRASFVGAALLVAGIACAALGVWIAAIAIAGIGLGLAIQRAVQPQRLLRLELADRVLVLEVDGDCLAEARALIEQIERRGVPRAIALP